MIEQPRSQGLSSPPSLSFPNDNGGREERPWECVWCLGNFMASDDLRLMVGYLSNVHHTHPETRVTLITFFFLLTFHSHSSLLIPP